MQIRFSSVAKHVEAEAQIQGLRQAGHPVKELVWQFRRLAGKVQDWPGRLLVHPFKNALDPELRRACSIRGVTEGIQNWYTTAAMLDYDLHPHRNLTLKSRPETPGTPNPNEASRAAYPKIG